MQKFDWKTLYFVLATFLGLTMLVMGVSSGANTALQQYVFKIESPKNQYPMEPSLVTRGLEKNMVDEEFAGELTDEQKKALEEWRVDYEAWRTSQKDYDYEAENRKRSMAFAVSMVIAGTPVFLLHAPFVFRKA